MASSTKHRTLFIPALSALAASSFAKGVHSGHIPHLPCYDSEDEARRFGVSLGPMGAMALYRVDVAPSDDGTMFTSTLVPDREAA